MKLIKKEYLIIGILLIQILIIGYLLFDIFFSSNMLGVSVAPMQTDFYTEVEHSKLKHYWEPQVNSVIDESSVHWLDKEVKYNINADSLHETSEYAPENAENNYRIVALGDSFTFGLFVNTEGNWTEVLETKLNTTCNSSSGFDIINLGVAGYDIEYSVERFRLRGQKYNPDLVIWLLKDDDFTRINEIMREHEKEYIEEMKESGEYERLIQAGNAYPHLSRLIKDMEKKEQELGTDTILSMQQDKLEELYKYFNKRLLILTFDYTPSEYKSILKKQADYNNNVNYLELSNIYDNAEELSYSPDDYHPTEEGHRVIAEDIYDYLAESDLIECN